LSLCTLFDQSVDTTREEQLDQVDNRIRHVQNLFMGSVIGAQLDHLGNIDAAARENILQITKLGANSLRYGLSCVARKEHLLPGELEK